MIPVFKIIRQIERFIVYRILHVDDTPHRLALGIGLGIFIAWTPTIGVQMVLVLLLATICRANRPVGIPVVWISNPLTAAPIYYINYRLGGYLLGLFGDRVTMEYGQLKEMLYGFHSFTHILINLFSTEFWYELLRLFLNISADLWIGSLILALFLGLISYIISYKVIVWYRTHSPRGRRFFARIQRHRYRNS